MSPKLEAREALSEYVDGVSHLSEGHLKQLTNCATNFAKWCTLNQQPALPTTDQTVLRFFEANLDLSWSADYLRAFLGGIAMAHDAEGHTFQPGEEIGRYIKFISRNGEQIRKKRTEALDLTTIETVAAAILTPSLVVRRRQAVALIQMASGRGDGGYRPGSWSGFTQRTPAENFAVTDTDVRIRLEDGPNIIFDQAVDPLGFQVLTGVLADNRLEKFPLSKVQNPEIPEFRRAVRNDATAIAASWRLARNCSSASAIKTAALTLTPADRAWFISCFIPQRSRDFNSLGIFLVGLTTGLRGASLVTLNLEDMTATTTGYRLQHVRHKAHLISLSNGGPGLPPIEKRLDHLSDTSAHCPPHCPACAVDRILVENSRTGTDLSEALFGTRCVAGVQAKLKKLMKKAGIEEVPVGARTMRVTAASLAHQAGMTLAEIQQEITNHESLDGARTYVRYAHPWAEESTTLAMSTDDAAAPQQQED